MTRPSPRSIPPARRTVLAGGVAAVLGLGVAGCADDGGSSGAGGSDGGAGARNGEGATSYPLEIANCEATAAFDAAPTRVVLLESAPVTALDGIGVLDRVVAKAGSFPAAYYGDDLGARVDRIEVLSDDLNASGHLQISQEVVIAQNPDLVLGLPDGVTREALAGAGAQVLVQNVFCAAGGAASFEDLYDEVRQYGEVFDRPAAAKKLITSLRGRIDSLESAAANRSRASAAVLYPSLGGGPLYSYGAGSMATPQLDAVGLDNCFAHVEDRVFEVETEALIDADPEYLIVLHQGEGDASGLVDEVVGAAGMSAVRAVEHERVLPLLFNFTEPATPLVIDGAERIARYREGGAASGAASDAGGAS